ncbi:MAG: hypothetical protein J6R80_05595, partial [Kiritimatiellae bacterium]|nr:hypothetical protein [Kiritimatiellia bacterium]
MSIKFVVAGLGAAMMAGCCALDCQKTSSASVCPKAYPESVNEGFVSLFNGVDLEGWTGATGMYGVDPKEPGVLQCFPDRQVK